MLSDGHLRKNTTDCTRNKNEQIKISKNLCRDEIAIINYAAEQNLRTSPALLWQQFNKANNPEVHNVRPVVACGLRRDRVLPIWSPQKCVNFATKVASLYW